MVEACQKISVVRLKNSMKDETKPQGQRAYQVEVQTMSVDIIVPETVQVVPWIYQGIKIVKRETY